MMRQRAADIDLLRTGVIVSAFVLHFDSTADVGIFSRPSGVVQEYLFSVGGMFFFLAGYLARKVYLERFAKNGAEAGWGILMKGVKLTGLYIGYVFLMHVLTGTAFEAGVYPFLLHHPFYTKVIFTFGLLYMLTPAFLWATARKPWVLMGVMAAITGVVLGYHESWGLPRGLAALVVDRAWFLYPILPSLVVYGVGYGVAAVEARWGKEARSWKWAAGVMLIMLGHVVLCRMVGGYGRWVADKQWYTLVEAAMAYGALVVARWVDGVKWVRSIAVRPGVLCLGIMSLHFYVISNMLLSLSSLSKVTPTWEKGAGFAGIFVVAYLFTWWRFISVYDPSTMKRRSGRVERGRVVVEPRTEPRGELEIVVRGQVMERLDEQAKR